jgi:hypothetical protein
MDMVSFSDRMLQKTNFRGMKLDASVRIASGQNHTLNLLWGTIANSCALI